MEKLKKNEVSKVNGGGWIADFFEQVTYSYLCECYADMSKASNAAGWMPGDTPGKYE